jgi:hypothetical protein
VIVRTKRLIGLLDRATPFVRDLIVGNLERSTQCAADGVDQSFGIPRAVTGTRAVKQGWSGYGSTPACPCVEGQVNTPARRGVRPGRRGGAPDPARQPPDDPGRAGAGTSRGARCTPVAWSTPGGRSWWC